MDYEKKYNEALELARANHKFYKEHTDCYEHFHNDVKLLEAIFPELRDSDDERIRKKLYNTVMVTPNDSTWFDGTSKEAMLAWLEKQKEQKPVDEKAVDEISKNVRKKWAIDFIHFLDEHRYDGKMCVSNGECMDIENAFISADWEKLIRYYNKYTQKPAEWSEEDKKVHSRLLNHYESLTHCVTTADRHQEIREELNFLKSIRPSWKPSEQKEQKQDKWSKKDKKILQSLHHVMNCADAQNAVKRDGLSVEDVCDFLFSIEPNWKPSEEQMSMLRAVINDPNNSGAESCQIALRGIYEHLKKL